MGLIVALLALLASDAAMAQQQHQTFKDANGRTLGRSVTDTCGNTTFYDPMGRQTGRAAVNGNTTTIYDPWVGRPARSGANEMPWRLMAC